MINFLNLALAGGLLAALTPLIIHFFHRRKLSTVRWGGMRFLRDALVRRRNELVLKDLLLLLLRVMILLLAALSLMRPVFNKDEAAIARNGRVGAVMIFDDSASTSAGRVSKTIDELKRLALAYLDTLNKGDEISVIRLSRINDTAEPSFNIESARDEISKIEASNAASDWLKLLEAGTRQFAKHANPVRELVVVTDGWNEGWTTNFTNLAAVILTPKDREEKNLRIEEVKFDRMVIPAGRETKVRIKMGGTLPGTVKLRISGAAERMVQAEQIVEMPVVFKAPGTNKFIAELVDVGDTFPYDDRREIEVPVVENIPVLLVDKANGLEYVEAALAPETNDLFVVRRITPDKLPDEELSNYKVIVSNESIPGLENFKGGILLGGGVASSVRNSATVNSVVQTHPLVQQLGDNWGKIAVKEYSVLKGKGVLTLSTGEPLLVEEGRTLRFATRFDTKWSDLPLQPVFVPLIRNMVAYLGQFNGKSHFTFNEEGKFESIHDYPLKTIKKLTSPEEITAELSPENTGSVELWRAFVFGSLLLLVIETSLSRKP